MPASFQAALASLKGTLFVRPSFQSSGMGWSKIAFTCAMATSTARRFAPDTISAISAALVWNTCGTSSADAHLASHDVDASLYFNKARSAAMAILRPALSATKSFGAYARNAMPVRNKEILTFKGAASHGAQTSQQSINTPQDSSANFSVARK